MLRMKLWLLQPIDIAGATRTYDGEGVTVRRWTWDCSNGFVVRASTEQEARSLAVTEAGDEGADAWLDAKLTSCVVVNAKGPSEIVLRDFMAG